MKHILGMAKSFLDLKGARSPKLELDYLRLVYAVKDLRQSGDGAQGYLVVLTPEILECVKRWENKYQGKNCVTVIDISLPGPIKNRLKLEKDNNKAGMIDGATGGKARGRSNANIGRQTGEYALRDRILESEPTVKQTNDENEFPCCVRWDFYGTVD